MTFTGCYCFYLRKCLHLKEMCMLWNSQLSSLLLTFKGAQKPEVMFLLQKLGHLVMAFFTTVLICWQVFVLSPSSQLSSLAFCHRPLVFKFCSDCSTDNFLLQCPEFMHWEELVGKKTTKERCKPWFLKSFTVTALLLFLQKVASVSNSGLGYIQCQIHCQWSEQHNNSLWEKQ